MSLAARFVGIITAPQATFRAVVAQPRWLGILALTTVVTAIFVALPLTTEGAQQAAIDASVRFMEGFGIRMPEEALRQMEQGAGRMPVNQGLTVMVAGPIVALILSAIVFVIFKIAGGDATFKQTFAVWVHAGIIGAIGQIFTGTVNYFRESVSSATNLGVMLPMLDEGSFLARLAGFIDLFVIWWLVVLSIGIGVANRKRTQSVATVIFSIFALIALGWAAITSMLGGS